MNVFEFALEFEKEGEKYYRELAEKVSQGGLKAVLNGLADDEVKHYQVMQQIANSEPLRLESSPVLGQAKQVFQELKAAGGEVPAEIAPLEMLEKALGLEKESEAYYRGKVAELESEDQKQIFELIADQEKAHARLVENLITYSQQPQTYLENAEFGKLEEL
jgi:rubrerythrin